MASIHANGAALHYQTRGEGGAVIALHGSASTGAQWRTMVGYLEGRFRVYTPDLPGYGLSDPALLGGSLTADAAAIGALVDRIGEPVHLVGHSYGAAVALKLAGLRPGLVRSLAVIEPVAFQLLRDDDDDRRLFREVMALAAAMMADAGMGRPRASIERFIDYWNGAGAWARTSPGLQSFLLGCLGRVLGDFRALAAETSGLADLARIACPVLAITGATAPAPSRRVTELVAGALPHATLRRIPEAGHMVPLTDPHLVDPMIGDHLVAAERAARGAAIAA